MGRYILYGLGKIFDRYNSLIKSEEIICLSDSNIANYSNLNGYNIVSPSDIKNIDFEYVVVFSSKYYDEIRQELIVKHDIDSKCIIPWTAFQEQNSDYECVELYLKHFAFYSETNRILDPFGLLYKYYYIRESLPTYIARIDSFAFSKTQRQELFYDTILKGIEETSVHYDTILWGGCTSNRIIELLTKETVKKSAIHMWTMEYCELFSGEVDRVKHSLSSYGDIQICYLDKVLLFVLETNASTIKGNIFVVTHKDYYRIKQSLYEKIGVAGYCDSESSLTDNHGDNISNLNRKINECTAMYWLWKNTESNVVGINHYRRFFLNNSLNSIDNILTSSRINNLLEKYDIIVNGSLPHAPSVSAIMKNSMPSSDAYENAYNIVRNKIQKYQPEYIDIFDDIIDSGHKMFVGNMMVTRWDIYDSYCKWLFSFIIEAAEEFDDSIYDDYSCRAIGFIAERMLTVWLLKNNLKVKELPIILL